MNFRYTKKAQQRLRLMPSALAPVEPEVFATDWHCNVVTLGRCSPPMVHEASLDKYIRRYRL